MKKTWFQLHLYCGLLFFPIMLILGLSALHINHHIPFFEEKQDWIKEQVQQFSYQETDDNQELADALKDSMQLMGWAPWWFQQRKDDSYFFRVMHNGAEHKMILNLKQGKIMHQRRSKGFWHTLLSLHFIGEAIPNAPTLVNYWHHYLNASVLYVIVAIISGIVLFIRRKRERLIGLLVCGISLLLSCFYLLYIWLVG